MTEPRKTFKIVGKHGLCVRGDKRGDLIISCSGQDVLRISETSDDHTINLFLYPLGTRKYNTQIIESVMRGWRKNSSCSHEILSDRGEESKKIFGNGPLISITEKGRKSLKKIKTKMKRVTGR